MNVVDLHPEELLDKKEAGTLTSAEALRLDVHLAQCAACRFEIGARADFSAELDADVAFEAAAHGKPGVANAPLGTSAIRVEPFAQPSKPETAIEKAPAATTGATSKRRARRSAVVLLAAAAVLVAGVGWGSWREGGPRALFVALTAPHEESPSVTERVRPKPQPHGSATGRPENVQSAPIEESIAPAVVPSIPEVSAPEAATVAPLAAPPRVEVTSVSHRTSSPRKASATPGVSAVAIAPEVAAPARVSSALLPPSAPVSEAATAPAVDASAASLFDAANSARARGDRDRAIALYHDLQMRFAGTTEARVSRVTLGRFLLDGGDANGALRAFDSALRDRPGELEEEALVGRALALRRLGRDIDESAAWSALLSAYPGSPHAARARARIATLAR